MNVLALTFVACGRFVQRANKGMKLTQFLKIGRIDSVDSALMHGLRKKLETWTLTLLGVQAGLDKPTRINLCLDLTKTLIRQYPEASVVLRRDIRDLGLPFRLPDHALT
jgi:hypothetical protein